jgi:TPP-dependent 2-oxoacid decarboxylase
MMNTTNSSSITIGDYLIQRLYEHGVHHVFGVPGDYILKFNKLMETSAIQFINTCDEQGAGFAADAYARLRGLGAVCVTYSVGGLKVANTTAQAFAEKSPVVVISGAPGLSERIQHPLLHHKVRNFDTQYKIFQELTVASTVLDDPNTAFAEIDRVLDVALRYKRPVYIELPRDLVNQLGNSDYQHVAELDVSDPDALSIALQQTVKSINAADRPVILADVEIHRFGLQNLLLQLTDKTNIPVADTMLGKSVIGERHPNYLGLYAGALGSEVARQHVESSDCVIMLGVILMDFNLGGFTAQLDVNRAIYVTSEKTAIQSQQYSGIRLQDFVQGLVQADIYSRAPLILAQATPALSFAPIPDRAVTIKRLFEQLDSFIPANTIVLADVGDALFGALELSFYDKNRFLATAYYASLGFAVPGAIGAQFANPHLRPLVLVGDGAFQMTGVELSTIARYGLNPIVIVLNNNGYGTERPILDGTFNDIQPWRYRNITELVGAGQKFDVHTETELETALNQSQAHLESFCIIEVHLDSHDMSTALQRLTQTLAKA